MDIFFLVAFVAPVVALLERNHRRTSSLSSTLGSVDDRDLERVRHDLTASPAPVDRLAVHPNQPTPAVCRPAVP